MSHLSSMKSDKAFHLRVFGMSTTAVLVELFSIGWIEINEYLDK